MGTAGQVREEVAVGGVVWQMKTAPQTSGIELKAAGGGAFLTGP